LHQSARGFWHKIDVYLSSFIIYIYVIFVLVGHLIATRPTYDITVLMHPNQHKYPGQMISVVEVDGYVYLAPFVETESEIFLKTIIPSRKATKQFWSTP
jgi:hypothetical protein